MASYLTTGKPRSNDPSFGNQRMQALSLNGQQRALYIRQQADSYVQQCDQTETQTRAQAAAQAEKARVQAAAQAETEKQAATIAATCRAANGQLLDDGSACAVSGIQDPVEDQDTPNATLDFPPVNITKLISQCAGIGGHWINDPGGGYVPGNTGWDCVLGKTNSVWDYGFEDAVTSFGSARWVVPIQDAAAMNSLDRQCTNAEDDFGLDSDKSGNVFACLVNGATEDDVLLTPTPRYAKAF
jgi:hypothetical protein